MDVELSYRRGLHQVFGKRPALSLSSDSLLYCLEFDWGGNALEINGRYQVLRSKNPEWFFRLLRVSQHNAAGERLEEVVAQKAWRWVRWPLGYLTMQGRKALAAQPRQPEERSGQAFLANHADPLKPRR
jgi:hypothetical protein